MGGFQKKLTTIATSFDENKTPQKLIELKKIRIIFKTHYGSPSLKLFDKKTKSQLIFLKSTFDNSKKKSLLTTLVIKECSVSNHKFQEMENWGIDHDVKEGLNTF